MVEALSPEALREANAFRARGRLGDIEPDIALTAPPRTPWRCDCEVRWRCQRVRRTRLRVRLGPAVVLDSLVPANGRTTFRPSTIGRYAISLRGLGRTGWREASVETVVFAPPPSICLEAPRRITVGDAAEISWRVEQADSVRLALDSETHLVDGVGHTVLRPLICKGHVIALEAEGPGGRAARRSVLQVVAPPMALQAPAVVHGVMGEEARIPYDATGARTLAIEGQADAAHCEDIPLRGTILVWMGIEPERLRLVATGHDGRSIQRAIDLAPWMPDFDIGPELRILAGRGPR
jgi:hypothetical protein